MEEVQAAAPEEEELLEVEEAPEAVVVAAPVAEVLPIQVCI